jgi:hypothetical protein
MARVPRALQAAALPKRCSTLEPTPRRIGFELGTIGALSLARKACCRMVILIRGIDELSIIMVIRTSLSFV